MIKRVPALGIFWAMAILAALILSMAFQGPAQAASVDRYGSESRLIRALLECDENITGWCDTAVDPSTDFRGELFWSAWGATLSVHTCWEGTNVDCLDIQSELLFRFVVVGSDNVTTYIRAYDLYIIGEQRERYFHILNWTQTQQQVVGQLEDGRKYVLVFTGVEQSKAYLWSD